MKIEPDEFRKVLIVDVQTRRDGNSSMKIASDDCTEVWYGGLCADVHLLDLGICVVMDPDETAKKWRDIAWARARAMDVMCRPDIAPLIFTAMADFHFKLGKRAGREELQKEFRETLGIVREG